MNSNERNKITAECETDSLTVIREVVDVRAAGAEVDVVVNALEIEADGEVLEEVEVEVHVRLTDGRLPRAKRYIIKVDTQKLVTEHSHMTGQAILTLAGNVPPKNHKLTQLFRDHEPKSIGLDEAVDFCAPGVECFVTLPLEQVAGDAAPRREFELPSADHRLLDLTKCVWETVLDGKTQWLFINKFPIPSGYNVSEAVVALQIPGGYPGAQIDMACFSPALVLSAGRSIANLSNQAIAGRPFQCWSRHRTAVSAWRSGIDNITTHLAYVTSWLEKEAVGQ